MLGSRVSNEAFRVTSSPIVDSIIFVDTPNQVVCSRTAQFGRFFLQYVMFKVIYPFVLITVTQTTTFVTSDTRPSRTPRLLFLMPKSNCVLQQSIPQNEQLFHRFCLMSLQEMCYNISINSKILTTAPKTKHFKVLHF